MFKNMKLSGKLWGFTALLLAAILIVAGSSIKSIKSMISANEHYSEAAEYNLFVVHKEVDHLNWMEEVQALFTSNNETIDVQLDHKKCSLGKFLHGGESKRLVQSEPGLEPFIEAIKEPHSHLHESGKAIKTVWRQRHEGLIDLLKDRLIDHHNWAEDVSRIVVERNPQITVQTDPTRCAFGKFLASGTYANYAKDSQALRAAMEAAKEPHLQLHGSVLNIKAALQAGDYHKAGDIYENVTLNKLHEVQEQFDKAIEAEEALLKAQAEAHRIFETKTLPAVQETGAKIEALSEQLNRIEKSSGTNMISTGIRSEWLAGIITVVAFILGGILSFMLIRSIIKPVNRIIEDLNEGADQVASASGQVSSSSQQLAEGSSEQAASIEETSSSLEEMSSMTKQNADNANQANNLMKEASQVVSKANDSMSDLTTSMEEISKASEETSKIIKTIDEIAFQTNLLALNAAVEAARAGEAGAGFAVVANEVRNLAMRAADAAKNTADLIEVTVKKVKDGGELVATTNDAFIEVADSSVKVGKLVGEITAASKEQAEGIEQVNKVVVEMDKVVQQNAANAEESASASEEMNAQAEQMKSIVTELVSLVDGRGKGFERGTASTTKISTTGNQETVADPAANFTSKIATAHQAKEVSPEQVIPMADEDFKDF